MIVSSKLTVEFNDEVSSLLEELAKKKGTSKVEVLRRAIGLYSYVSTEAGPTSENRLSITKDGKQIRDIILT